MDERENNPELGRKGKDQGGFRVNSIEECDNIDSHILVMRAVAANYLQRPLDSIGNVLLFCGLL